MFIKTIENKAKSTAVVGYEQENVFTWKPRMCSV